ncbi:MAG: M48 family metallopeptidase [Thermodesulfobacteriota bacterium]
MRTLASLFTVLAFAGCAPTLKTPEVSGEEARVEAEKQREMAFSVFTKRWTRLMGISMPLLVAGAGFCRDDLRSSYGFLVHDSFSYGEDFRDIAESRFGFGDGVAVRYVHPELAAAGAGLMAGDRLVSINGVDVNTGTKGLGLEGKAGKKRKGPAAKARELIEKSALEHAPLTLEVERDVAAFEVIVEGVEACGYNVGLSTTDAVNAFADGRNVVVTTGMMRFTESDGELVLVVGHEIAHNAFGHIDKLYGNSFIGLLVDIIIVATTGVDTQGLFSKMAGQAYSREFEAEADYAGLYIAARGDYDITGAANFWRRMAVEHPGAIKDNFSSTHPSAPRRFLAIESTVEEIEEKRRRGEPLVPEEKKREEMEKKEEKGGGD